MQYNYSSVKQQQQSDRIAQWISAFDFGSKGRGFDSHCGRRLLRLRLRMLLGRRGYTYENDNDLLKKWVLHSWPLSLIRFCIIYKCD